MSASNSPNGSSSEDDFDQREQMTKDYNKFLNTVSLGTLFVAPILIALPPRKLDFYTFSLGGAWIAAAYHKDLGSGPLRGFQQVGMPRSARELKEREKQIAEAREQRRLLEEPGAVSAASGKNMKTGSLLEEKAKEIWLGGETEGWKERRLREERERLAKGEGYGSMIMDQIWEVWNWGDKSGKVNGEQAGERQGSKKG
jgi:hypothetical protein